MKQSISRRFTMIIGQVYRTFMAPNAPRMTLHRWLRFLTILAAVAQFRVLEAVAKENEDQLFDGRTFHGWTTLDGKPVKDGWEVVDGMIHLRSSGRRAGDIVTEREYGDLDLSFEWKIAPGGNSGLKYRVRQYDGKARGCEYQILDDAKYHKRVTSNTSAGALYGLFEPNQEKRLNPPGKFNSARIVIRGNQVQHWLNGRLIVSATIGSKEWNSRVAQSKFSELKDFAVNARGKLMLTDHGSEVWYRNFEFHPLLNAARNSSSSQTSTPNGT
jgi:hypothetical protein